MFKQVIFLNPFIIITWQLQYKCKSLRVCISSTLEHENIQINPRWSEPNKASIFFFFFTNKIENTKTFCSSVALEL